MKKQLVLVLAIVFLGVPAAAPASTQHKPSPSLIQMAREVDSQRIERSIRTLAGFGTRHSLSSQTDPERGIGAARDWLYRELQRSAARSGGRMSVELQSYIQGPAERIPEPTVITKWWPPCAGVSQSRQTATTWSAATTTRAAATRSTRCVTHPGPTTTHPAWQPCSSWPG